MHPDERVAQYRTIDRTLATVAFRAALPLGCQMKVTTGCTIQPGTICAM